MRLKVRAGIIMNPKHQRKAHNKNSKMMATETSEDTERK